MSRPSRGPYIRIKSQRGRQDAWVIFDGSKQIRTGCPPDQRARAEAKLGEYLAQKHRPSRAGGRSPAEIPVTDVLQIYATDVAPKHARPSETGQRILRLGEFWAPYTLADVNGTRCREYVKWRTAQQRRTARPESTGRSARPITTAQARRELEDLRSAINFHRREGLCSEIVGVALPEKPAGRVVWLTRPEVARMVRAAWRATQELQDGSRRKVGEHVARFILIAYYTGSRSGAICGASYMPTIGRGWLDLDEGVFYRRAQGARETKKRQPPVKLPGRLLLHLRRWKAMAEAAGIDMSRAAPVMWGGKPISDIRKGFMNAAIAAGLPVEGPDKVTPHTMRHTAATHLMQAGVDIWQAAGFMGMTFEVLRDTYGHHHPMFQEEAANALSRRRT